MTKKKLPFGIPRPPQVATIKVARVAVEDHFGESSVMVETWWNGEGITIQVNAKSEEQRVLLTWQEWTAVRLAVAAIHEAGKAEA